VSRDLECRTIQVRRFETTADPSFQPAKVELHMVPSAALRFFSNSHSPKPHRCVSRTGACNLFQWYLHRKPSRVIFRHGPSILHVSPLCRSLELALLLSTLSTSSFSLYRRSSSLASLFRLGSFPRMHRNGRSVPTIHMTLQSRLAVMTHYDQPIGITSPLFSSQRVPNSVTRDFRERIPTW
jgi:hypothetical protein